MKLRARFWWALCAVTDWIGNHLPGRFYRPAWGCMRGFSQRGWEANR